jgi:hypothetical protein
LKKFLIIAVFTIVLGIYQLSLPAVAAGTEKPGAPSELIGHWGKNKEQCRSWHRRADNVTSITKDIGTFCGGSGCEATIISHKKIHDGYILKFTSRGNPTGYSLRYGILDNDTVEVFETNEKLMDTLVRCNMKDKIAGIGLPADQWLPVSAATTAPNGIFAAYYALEIQSVCPKLKANKKLIVVLVREGLVLYDKFLTKTGLHYSSSREEDLRNEANSVHGNAKYAVEQDAREIPNLCTLVLEVFGKDGKIFPDLIQDESRKL